MIESASLVAAPDVEAKPGADVDRRLAEEANARDVRVGIVVTSIIGASARREFATRSSRV